MTHYTNTKNPVDFPKVPKATKQDWAHLEQQAKQPKKRKGYAEIPDPDNMVEIPLDFSDAELLVLFKQAHEADLTFNQFVERALTEYIERMTKDETLLNKLDGSSEPRLVQAAWPYPS